MTIEFHSPKGFLQNWEIDYVRDKLIEFHNLDKEINRAEVYFRNRDTAQGERYICEIVISIYGNSFLIKRMSDSYLKAARDAIRKVGRKVNEIMLESHRTPPDETTTTVSV